MFEQTREGLRGSLASLSPLTYRINAGDGEQGRLSWPRSLFSRIHGDAVHLAHR